MITVQTKVVASPLSLAVDTKSSKSDSGSFATLLNSLATNSESSTQKNGALLLHLSDKKELPNIKTSSKNIKTPVDQTNVKEQTNKSDLLSLLKSDEQKTHLINPDLATAVDAKTLKSVMKDAKNYLKDQIKATDAFKKGEIQELPKTTQGLVALAKKVGVDVSKITVETVQTKSTKEPKATQKTDVKPDLNVHSKIDTNKEDLSTENLTPKVSLAQNDSKAQKTQISLKDNKELATTQTVQAKTTDLKTEHVKNDIVKETPVPQTKTNVPTTALAQTEQKTQSSKTDTFKDDTTLHVKNTEPQNENIEIPKQVQKKDITLTQPLTQDESFKKMVLFTMPDETLASHSTAELVDKKQIKTSQEQSMTKSPSPLSALLHGDKIAVQATDTKTDSKVDSKIKTPSSVLSKLLHGENQQTAQTSGQTSSIDEGSVQSSSSNQNNGLQVSQTESDLTVKMHEAKQMVKYLAQDIKQSIEDYKPPFTRIKAKLNPQKFGEVDLTVVQRGKNVHVNISSNNTAIAALSQNSGDLKTQLTQNGMNNATLNFNSSTDTQNQQQQQQQQRNGHQKESAKKAYEAFNQDETNEEILSSLEIVIARYV